MSYQDFSGVHGSKLRSVSSNVTEPLIQPEEKLEEKTQHGFFHPKRKFYAYSILFVTCFISTSGYFIYDSVGAVQEDIQTNFGIGPNKFGLLYSVYSFPNCLLPFFGGYLLDKFGIRFGTVLCCSLVFLGSVIVAVAPYFQSYYLLLVGRVIFGLGAETSYVAQNSIIVAWFADKEMALAMGLSVSAGRLGTWLTFNANPLVVKHFGNWKFALFLAAGFGAIEFLAGIIFYIMDAAAERITRKFTSEVLEVEQPIDLRAVYKFSGIFWLLTLCATAYYSVVFPFESTAGVLLADKYKYSQQAADAIISLLPLTSMILSPLFGLVVDKVGRRVVLVIFGILFMTGSLLYMIYTPYTPIPAVVVIGMAYSLVPSAMWPCLPMVIEDQYISTAFGLLSSILNIGLVVSYYLQGWVDQITSGNVEKEFLFYAGVSVLGGVVALGWYFLDLKRGSKCNQVVVTIQPISASSNIVVSDEETIN